MKNIVAGLILIIVGTLGLKAQGELPAEIKNMAEAFARLDSVKIRIESKIQYTPEAQQKEDRTDAEMIKYGGKMHSRLFEMEYFADCGTQIRVDHEEKKLWLLNQPEPEQGYSKSLEGWGLTLPESQLPEVSTLTDGKIFIRFSSKGEVIKETHVYLNPESWLPEKIVNIYDQEIQDEISRMETRYQYESLDKKGYPGPGMLDFVHLSKSDKQWHLNKSLSGYQLIVQR